MLRLLLTVAAVACLAVGATGCSKKKGRTSASDVSCEAVGEYAMTITQRGISDLQGKAKKHAEAGLTGLLPEVRKNTIKRCKADKWPEALRRCYLRARNYADSEACGKPPGAVPATTPSGPMAPTTGSSPVPTKPDSEDPTGPETPTKPQ